MSGRRILRRCDTGDNECGILMADNVTSQRSTFARLVHSPGITWGCKTPVMVFFERWWRIRDIHG